MTFTIHKSIADIAHRYDGFILDQFGVMHNGKESIPGAVDCINNLKALGKKLVILSNTSQPSKNALQNLPKMGFEESDFEGAITSGEEASHFIKQKYGNIHSSSIVKEPVNTKKALWFTWDQSDKPLEFLKKCGNVEGTLNIDEADFVIAHGSGILRDTSSNIGQDNSKVSDTFISLGSFHEDGDLSEIDPILKKCTERNLPMVCANPDLIVQKPNGQIAHMPGKIASRYEKLGGHCEYFGKPYVEHFNASLKKLQMTSAQVAHVGDSLHHDIVGANAAGIASIFVTSGIHCDDLGARHREVPCENVLKDFFEEEGEIFPTHVVPLFRF